MSDAYAAGDYSGQRQFARDLAEKLVEAAKNAGAVDADAAVGISTSLSAKARDGAIEDVTRSSSRTAGLRVIVDGKLGFATSADVPGDEDAIAEMAKTAVSLARVSTASSHNVIPQSTAPASDELEARIRALANWDASITELTPDWATETALKMEAIVSGIDGISTVDDVGASAGSGTFALASSSGFSGSYGGTSVSCFAGAVAEDHGGKKQTDMWWDAARHLQRLEDPEAVARRAAERVLARVGAKKIATTRAPVIFDPSMSRGFFAALLGAMNGDAVSRGASFLKEKKGEAVLKKGIRVFDDPLRAGGFGSRPFDGEGLEVSAMDLIDEDGVLRTWLHDARSAHRMGESPTGHARRSAGSLPGAGSSNVKILGGEGDLNAIIADTERGLLVTRLLGHSPDPITGDYSRGAAGFWIENGEIQHPVEEITIAGHMLEMMLGIDRVGEDWDHRSSLEAPSIRFGELTISGN
jgi:PmbA protein